MVLYQTTAAHPQLYIQAPDEGAYATSESNLLTRALTPTQDENMVVIRKVSPEQWAYEINRAAQVRMAQKQKARSLKFRYYETFLSRLMPLPILIGSTAIILIVYFYGWQDLGKMALSWVVSITIISTLVYHMFKRFEAELG